MFAAVISEARQKERKEIVGQANCVLLSLDKNHHDVPQLGRTFPHSTDAPWSVAEVAWRIQKNQCRPMERVSTASR